MSIISAPPAEHHCNPGWELQPCRDRGQHPSPWGCPITEPHDHAHNVGAFARAGSVWACECGRTFVARPSRYTNVLTSEWHREGRLARWLRERQAA